MLRLLNLALMRGTRLLYAHANLIASPGERIGLVGPNGCGKSTLFAAILGDLAPEDGELETPPHERIAHVAQSFTVEDISCIDCVLSGHAPLMNAKAALKRAEASGDEMALAAAHSELAEVNEGAVVAQAKAILAGLGFAEADSCRKVHDFSGGWRNRIQLARALMRPADLLLLDEPTNHLDIDSLICSRTGSGALKQQSSSFRTTVNSSIVRSIQSGLLKTARSAAMPGTTPSLNWPALKNSVLRNLPAEPMKRRQRT